MEQPPPRSPTPSPARKVGVYPTPEKHPARGRLLWIVIAVALAVVVGLYLLFSFVV